MELLNPRYKVLILYPNSPFLIGDILHKNGIHYSRKDNPKSIHENEIDKYPDIFQKLEWWEERTIDELISVKFVKIAIYRGYWLVGDIVPVINYAVDLKNKRLESYTLKYNKTITPDYVLPASEQEYNEFIKSKT